MLMSDFFIPKILNKIRMLNAHSEEEIDMMRYSLQTILWEIEKLLILSIVFALFHKLDFFLITLAVLLTIRTNAGGYHSNTSLGCLTWSFFLFFLATIALPLLEIHSIGIGLILVISLLITLYAAPIYHVQREHLLRAKAKKGKLLSCIITLIWALVIWIYKDNAYAISSAWIIFLQNMQLLYEYIRRRKMA